MSTPREDMLSAIQLFAEEWKAGTARAGGSPGRTAVLIAMDRLEATRHSQPARDAAPELVEAEKWLREMDDGGHFAGYPTAIVAELDRLRALVARQDEAQQTVYADGDGPEQAIRNALGARSYESRSQCEACGYGGEFVYAVTLTARRCVEPRK